MKNKKFDCVEIKRKSQEIIYNEIKNMNKTEELEFWRNGTIELRNLQNSSKKKPVLTSMISQRKKKS